MIEFKRMTDTSSPDWDDFIKLYVAAFPAEERRFPEAQEELMLNEKDFHCCVLKSDNKQIGLFSYWDFGWFAYAEHFAIKEELRGHKFGEKAMKQFVNDIKKPVILEAETPDSDIAKRRIGFYQRIGYKLSDIEYMQPAYDPTLSSIPLVLMEYGGNILENEETARKAIGTIYRYAYRREEDI